MKVRKRSFEVMLNDLQTTTLIVWGKLAEEDAPKPNDYLHVILAFVNAREEYLSVSQRQGNVCQPSIRKLSKSEAEKLWQASMKKTPGKASRIAQLRRQHENVLVKLQSLFDELQRIVE